MVYGMSPKGARRLAGAPGHEPGRLWETTYGDYLNFDSLTPAVSKTIEFIEGQASCTPSP